MYLVYGSEKGQACATFGWTIDELLDTLKRDLDSFKIEEPYIVFLPVNRKDWEALGNES